MMVKKGPYFFYLIIYGIFHFQNIFRKAGAILLPTTVLLFDRKKNELLL